MTTTSGANDSVFAEHSRSVSLLSMRSWLRKVSSLNGALAFVVVVAIASSAFAFDIGKILNNKPKEPDKFSIIRVDRLASLMADSNSHVNIYDANGWGLRSRAGVIPGAHLLTSDDKYDVASELPSDKSAKLVFYCADLH